MRHFSRLASGLSDLFCKLHRRRLIALKLYPILRLVGQITLYKTNCTEILSFPLQLSGKKYDALIAYNNNDKTDRDFVTTRLLKVLQEQHGYKLFIEERDALGGARE